MYKRQGLFGPQEGAGLLGMLLQLVGGVIIAVGLVLPGISVSQMLYMLGIYEGIMENIGNLNILPLDVYKRQAQKLPRTDEEKCANIDL